MKKQKPTTTVLEFLLKRSELLSFLMCLLTGVIIGVIWENNKTRPALDNASQTIKHQHQIIQVLKVEIINQRNSLDDSLELLKTAGELLKEKQKEIETLKGKNSI